MARELTNGLGKQQAHRILLLAGAELFAVSCTFPVVASLLQPDAIPLSLGVIDVATAIALVGVGIAIVAIAPKNFPAPVIALSFHAYRALASVLLLLLVLFFLAGDAIRWSIILVGLAWRAWLLVLVLPSWLTEWQRVAKAPHGDVEKHS